MKLNSRPSLVSFALLAFAVSPLAASPTENSAVKPAQPIVTAAPKYPYLERRAEAAAEVTVAFIVDVRGKVVGAKVTNTSNREFNEVTLDAIRQWSFAPALKGGKPVEARVRQTFVFSVSDLPETNGKTTVTTKKNTR